MACRDDNLDQFQFYICTYLGRCNDRLLVRYYFTYPIKLKRVKDNDLGNVFISKLCARSGRYYSRHKYVNAHKMVNE